MKELAYGCRVYDPTEGHVVVAGAWKERTLVSPKTAPTAITQTINDYSAGPSPATLNPVAEETLYVVHGTGTSWIDGFSYRLEPGAALYVPPGSTCSIEASPGDTLRVVSVRFPDDPGRRIVHSPQHEASGKPPRRMVYEDEREMERAGKDRSFRVLAHADLGATGVTQFVGWIPASKAPLHWHEYEECICVLEGSGTLHLKGQPNAAEFRTGSCIFLPRHSVHCLENPGPSSIRLLGVFHPSGSPGAAYEDA